MFFENSRVKDEFTVAEMLRGVTNRIYLAGDFDSRSERGLQLNLFRGSII